MAGCSAGQLETGNRLILRPSVWDRELTELTLSFLHIHVGNVRVSPFDNVSIESRVATGSVWSSPNPCMAGLQRNG
jgi:hypothetical protein